MAFTERSMGPTREQIFDAGNSLIGRVRLLSNPDLANEERIRFEEQVKLVASGLDTEETFPSSMNILRILFASDYDISLRTMVRSNILQKIDSISSVMTSDGYTQGTKWPIDSDGDFLGMMHKIDVKVDNLLFLGHILTDEQFDVSPTGAQQSKITEIMRANERVIGNGLLCLENSSRGNNNAEELVALLAKNTSSYKIAVDAISSVVTREDIEYDQLPRLMSITADDTLNHLTEEVLVTWALHSGMPVDKVREAFFERISIRRIRHIGEGRFSSSEEERALPILLFDIASSLGRNIVSEMDTAAVSTRKKRYKEEHPESTEEDIDPLQIPTIKFAGNYPTTEDLSLYREELRRFFEDSAHLERVVWIQNMPNDLLDDLGISGLRPDGGFVFIERLNRFGAETLAEKLWMNKNLSMGRVPVLNGYVFTVNSYDMVPRSGKYDLRTITDDGMGHNINNSKEMVSQYISNHEIYALLTQMMTEGERRMLNQPRD